ncbi:MAG TPA: Rv2231c family pyridoxal phosphate-dependent protein CobC [Micromonosporaceae bacterium]|nr:Rv2231c family pyridoxal phosphate-dependent protein CobC [Micromonosporaceae bacterium]
MRPERPAYDLRHHGDTETGPGLVDLAVNVRTDPAPAWLTARLSAAMGSLAAYPDQSAARAAVAARHGREPTEVLLTAGAAEAFVLLARAVRAGRAGGRTVVVHPQFTEPEAALAAAGHQVHRVLLDASDGFRLHPDRVPSDADLVVVGNPTNPTSTLHPAAQLSQLARPGRLLVVDEAFSDCVPGEPESLASRSDLPGLVVVRSLTKTWALAGLRVGYVLAGREIVEQLAAAQPLWPVSTPALAALEACSTAAAVDEAQRHAVTLAARRDHLVDALRRLGVVVAGHPAASFVLVRVDDGAAVRERMRARGWALRRGDTFPGLGSDWLRVAVRDNEVTDALAVTLAEELRRS